MLPKQVLYYGKDEPLPAQKHLRAGPLSLVYEAGDLRYIKLGDQEILRRVYVAVRDHNWDTILPTLSNVQMDVAGDSFRITYDVENKEGSIAFFWRGTIAGGPQGTITFSMAGEARSTFRRNRIGFCVLHPMACAGVPCQIEHVDGAIEEAVFPQYIAPQLVIAGLINPVHPFAEMRAMAHQVLPNLWAEVRFEGEVFEMEDQRNWTDASYKTYCTPLRLPFPAEVQAGTKISQSITLTLKGEAPEVQPMIASSGQQSTFVEEPGREANLTFSVGEEPPRPPRGGSEGRRSDRVEDASRGRGELPLGAGPLPKIGLGVASHGQPLTQQALTRLKALNLSHLRVDLDLAQPDYEARLRRASGEARALDVSLEVAVILSNAAVEELKALVATLEEIKPPVWAWLIFHKDEKSTTEPWLRLAREHLSGYDPTAKIGGGTNIFFTELNRARPPVEALDLVAYSINPQVHAFDNASLVETLKAQAVTVESARQFIGDRPLAITPITLKMRFNPNATGPEPEPAPPAPQRGERWSKLPPQVDERQMSLFGAGWTAGSLKYICQSDVQSVTYYETTGWLGVMEREAGSPLPDKFRSLPGAVYPLYHVLADVGEFAGGEVIPMTSSDILRVDGLALRKEGQRRVVLANLTAEPQQVTIQNLGDPVSIRQLNETNVEQAMQSPEAFRAQAGEVQPTSEGTLVLDLLPYGIARIDHGMREE
jgi:hypothetical protein